ncbi:mechanosensitive ion channel family protein [Halalkalicoccus subterraneus]|uniref:mechanosensitive ion channel family protein n=1 Tax=Halalkalicoccus subterraneus TaxID=2675002 RepID=UPI000EFD3755|nr:mechanosensitive ion channel family protein [Halalkalicoccus subterraneus]
MERILLQTGFPTSIDQFVAQYGTAIISTLTTIVLFGVAFIAAYYIGKTVLLHATERSLRARGFKEGVISLALSVVSILVLAGAVAVAATVAGFGTVLAAFATLGGALALGISFAAQDLISNFVAGIFIIKDEPFRVGDWIQWDGNEGVVREIKLRVTRIETFDNELVTVPNSQLANAVLVNPVANKTLRISYDFGIGYDDDIEQARAAILAAARTIDDVLSDPEPTAPVTDLGDSAVILTGRVWINPQQSSAVAVRTAFIEAVKKQFDSAEVDMPYPHTTLEGDVELNGSNTSSVA